MYFENGNILPGRFRRCMRSHTKYLTMKKLRLCGLLALQMFACSVSNAQYTSTQLHSFGQHVKAYSVMNSTDGLHPDETVRAGTMYYTNLGPNTVRLYDPWAYPHFLQVDNSDNITVSKIYGFRSVKAYVRAVSIVGDGNTSPNDAKYYITCQVRVPINASPWDLTGDRDCIVVMTVDRNGNVLQDAMIIRPNVTNNPNTPENFYPLHSLWHSNGSLYICGYVTDDNTNAPNEPMFRHSAAMGPHIKSFVLRCDPATGTVLNTFTYNTTPTTPQLPHLEEDYDIAVRLTEMAGGNVHVTGSVNNVRLHPVSPPPLEVFFSSTMNLLLDPSLTMLSSINDHFGFPWNTEGGNGSEYGVAIEEANNGNKFIVSNAFSSNHLGNQSFTALAPHQFMITEVDNNYAPMGGNTRYRFEAFDNAWALTTLPVTQASTQPGETRMLIAGMSTNTWCGTGGPYGFDYVMPFLHEVVMRPGSTDGGQFMKWVTYKTNLGTGAFTHPLSYKQIQDGVSNIAWNPVFASRARGNVDSNIHMYAPLLNKIDTFTLDHKSMSVEGSYFFSGGGLANLYTDNTAQCVTSNIQSLIGGNLCGMATPPTQQDYFVYEQVSQIGYSGNPMLDVTGTLDYEVVVEDMADISSANYTWTSTACDYSNGDYKTTNIPQLMAGKGVKMYPNPAQHELQVVLPAGTPGDEGIMITLSNMYGQRVATLYNGNAANLGILQLPDVASGMYMVEVRGKGNILHQQKLAIQQ